MIKALRAAHQTGIAKTTAAILLTTTLVGVTAIHAEQPPKTVMITVKNHSHAAIVFVNVTSQGHTLVSNQPVTVVILRTFEAAIAPNANRISWYATATKTGSTCHNGDANVTADGKAWKATIEVTACSDPKPTGAKKDAKVDVEFTNAMAFPVEVLVGDLESKDTSASQKISIGSKATFKLVADAKGEVSAAVDIGEFMGTGKSDRSCGVKLPLATTKRTVRIVTRPGTTNGCFLSF